MATWRVMPPLPGLDGGSAGDPVPMAGTMGYNISPLPGLDIGSTGDPVPVADTPRLVRCVRSPDRQESLADPAACAASAPPPNHRIANTFSERTLRTDFSPSSLPQRKGGALTLPKRAANVIFGTNPKNLFLAKFAGQRRRRSIFRPSCLPVGLVKNPG